MSEVNAYEVEGLEFEFVPDGSPFEGVLTVTATEGTFCSTVSLTKLGSRAAWAREAEKLYGIDVSRLKRALNELCTLRTEEVAAAKEVAEAEAKSATPPVEDERIDELVGRPGVLDRYVEDVARIRGVVKDRDPLRLQTLVALGAQLAPLPDGKLAGANLILTAEAGRGKNYICDAVSSMLPEEFVLAFESASAMSLYYRAENDPTVLKHRWIYPNEAEAADQLVEMLRPLLSGDKASHLTVNKTREGRNAAQELKIEGPVSITIPTVRNNLDAQLQTRMLVAELPDYPGRVAEHSRAASRQLLPGNAAEDHGPKVQTWQAALRSLPVRRVVFPMDREEFCFDSDEVSHGARLWTNMLGLMLAHAWLEQRNREVPDLPSGERAVVATPEDYEAAYVIFRETCERSVVNLSDTHRKIVSAVYELKQENTRTEGFAQRRIAEKAGVSVSTISDNKTYLTTSVKLLREAEGGGLTLVADADPSWWEKGDLLVGFPRPEQVRAWWQEMGYGFAPKAAEHTEHGVDAYRKPLGNAENSVRHPTEQPPNGAERPTNEDHSADGVRRETRRVRLLAEQENGLGKRETTHDDDMFGVFGGFEDGAKGVCIHGYQGDKGCYSCDPEHPYRKGNQ